jgi:hypothetical protein
VTILHKSELIDGKKAIRSDSRIEGVISRAYKGHVLVVGTKQVLSRTECRESRDGVRKGIEVKGLSRQARYRESGRQSGQMDCGGFMTKIQIEKKVLSKSSRSDMLLNFFNVFLIAFQY